MEGVQLLSDKNKTPNVLFVLAPYWTFTTHAPMHSAQRVQSDRDSCTASTRAPPKKQRHNVRRVKARHDPRDYRPSVLRFCLIAPCGIDTGNRVMFSSAADTRSTNAAVQLETTFQTRLERDTEHCLHKEIQNKTFSADLITRPAVQSRISRDQERAGGIGALCRAGGSPSLRPAHPASTTYCTVLPLCLNLRCPFSSIKQHLAISKGKECKD